MPKKSQACGDHCCCHEPLDFGRVKADAQALLKQAKNKFDKLEPAKKQQLKKNAAIGGAVVLGLFGLKKLFGGKKRK